MSRRNKKSKIRAHVRGRRLKALGTVAMLPDDYFSYRGRVYSVDDFPPHVDINLDTTSVIPVRYLEDKRDIKPIKKNKKKKKKNKKKKVYVAVNISNIEGCPDVRSIFED